MTWDEIRRREFSYELIRWEFYVGVAAFIVFATYFPWGWIADSATARSFVSIMEIIAPSIEGLDQQYRHLAISASKVQLSFVHFLGVALLILRLINQKCPIWRDVSPWRFFIMLISATVISFYPAYFLFFWDGTFYSENPGKWHRNGMQVVATHTLMWLYFILVCSFISGATREIIRRNRSAGECAEDGD